MPGQYSSKARYLSMDGIIFDVDGTLWDSTDTVAESWTAMIRRHTDLNLTITGAELKNLFGKTMEEIGNALFPSMSEEEKAPLLKHCYEYENELLLTKPGRLYDHVRETLELLSAKYPLFIVSNSQLGYIDAMLDSTGLRPLFQDTLCYGQTLTDKDETLLQLMEKNQIKEVVYVGDTQGDYNACKKAGVPFIYASYGFGEVSDAPRTIHDFSELADL